MLVAWTAVGVGHAFATGGIVIIPIRAVINTLIERFRPVFTSITDQAGAWYALINLRIVGLPTRAMMLIGNA